MTLDKLGIGKTGIIKRVDGNGELRCRLLDMGIVANTKVTVIKVAPFKDPIEIYLRGYKLTLRIQDAKKIHIVHKE